MLKVTLDTNSIIDYANNKNKEMDKIMKLAEEGKIQISKTDVMDTELTTKKSLEASSKLEENIGDGLVGSSRVQHSKVGSEKTEKEQDEIRILVFPSAKDKHFATERQIRDVMHLHTHRRYGGDYFLTSDKDILGAKERLKTIGICVITPSEFPFDDF